MCLLCCDCIISWAIHAQDIDSTVGGHCGYCSLGVDGTKLPSTFTPPFSAFPFLLGLRFCYHSYPTVFNIAKEGRQAGKETLSVHRKYQNQAENRALNYVQQVLWKSPFALTATLRGDLLSAAWFLDENYSSLEGCITSRILKVQWRQAVRLS